MTLKNYSKLFYPLINEGIFFNMMLILKEYVMKLMSLFVKRPERKLTWTKEDYLIGMRWAKTQPHPFIQGKSLWDLCYDRNETVFTIDNLNKFLFNEI
jgi:hypothetical protein